MYLETLKKKNLIEQFSYLALQSHKEKPCPKDILLP